MKFIGNILWLLFGGLECAIGYFTGALALFVTIIGIPFGIQVFKLGLLCLWPFGSKVSESNSSGCLSMVMNIIWIITVEDGNGSRDIKKISLKMQNM